MICRLCHAGAHFLNRIREEIVLVYLEFLIFDLKDFRREFAVGKAIVRKILT